MTIFSYVDSILWIILGVSIAAAILVSFLRSHVGRLILDILLNVSLAIIAAFIFYTVVDVSKRAREYEAAAPYVSRQIVTMKGDVLAVCREAARVSGRELPAEWAFNHDEVVEIFNATHLHSPVNMVYADGRQGNLLDYIVDRARRTNGFLVNLLIFSYLLGGEATAQIADIQSDPYLMQVQMLSQLPESTSNQNLSFLVLPLADHYNRITRLEKWAAVNHLLTSPW